MKQSPNLSLNNQLNSKCKFKVLLIKETIQREFRRFPGQNNKHQAYKNH